MNFHFCLKNYEYFFLFLNFLINLFKAKYSKPNKPAKIATIKPNIASKAPPDIPGPIYAWTSVLKKLIKN